MAWRTSLIALASWWSLTCCGLIAAGCRCGANSDANSDEDAGTHSVASASAPDVARSPCRIEGDLGGDGTVDFVQLIEKDNKGREVRLRYPKSDLERVDEIHWSVDGLTKTLTQREDGAVVGHESTRFDPAGRVVEIRKDDARGSVLERVERTYDGQGRLVSERFFDADLPEWTEERRLRYDGAGRPAGEDQYRFDAATPFWRVEVVYAQDGLHAEEVATDLEKQKVARRTSLTLDKVGQVVGRRTELDDGRVSVERVEYEAGLPVTTEVRFNGKVDTRTRRFYECESESVP